MAFVRLAFFPGGTMDQYSALDRALKEAPVPAGRLVFAAGPRDGGLQVVQIWESRKGLESFNQLWLSPAMSLLGPEGFPTPPTVTDFETHELRVRAGLTDADC